MSDDIDDTGRAADSYMATRLTASGIFLSGEDDLRLVVLNALAGVTVRLSGRFLPLTGPVLPFVYDFVPTSDRTVNTKTCGLGEGWLLGATITCSAGAPGYGRCYAQLQVLRGDGAGAFVMETLAQGYVSSVARISWPANVLRSPVEDPGMIRSITGTDPVAGAEVSETVPAGARWELLAINVVLTTSAVAGNRIPQLQIDDGANLIVSVPSLLPHGPTVTSRHQWAEGLPHTALIQAVATPSGLPLRLQLLAGYRIKTLTSAIDVGDNYAAPQYAVREWIEAA